MDGNRACSRYISDLAHHIQAFAPLQRESTTPHLTRIFSRTLSEDKIGDHDDRIHHDNRVLHTYTGSCLIAAKAFQPDFGASYSRMVIVDAYVFWLYLHRRLPCGKRVRLLQGDRYVNRAVLVLARGTAAAVDWRRSASAQISPASDLITSDNPPAKR
jgi:hypothetical protein